MRSVGLRDPFRDHSIKRWFTHVPGLRTWFSETKVLNQILQPGRIQGRDYLCSLIYPLNSYFSEFSPVYICSLYLKKIKLLKIRVEILPFYSWENRGCGQGRLQTKAAGKSNPRDLGALLWLGN